MIRIAVDFDGTIVTHQYPRIGIPVPDAIRYMRAFKAAGAQLILWTMRSGESLEEAVRYCREAGVVFDGVNEGIDDRDWTTSPKVYANCYVDDAAYGCPLIHSGIGERPYVDWSVVGPNLLKMIIM